MRSLAKSFRWLSWVAILMVTVGACASPSAPTTVPAPPAPKSATVAPSSQAPAAKPVETQAPTKPVDQQAAATPAAVPAAVPTAVIGQTFSSPGPAPAGLTNAPVELTFWHHISPPIIAVLKEYIKSYQQLHPNVKINFESYSLPDHQQKLLVAMSTGTGPEVFALGDWFLPTYIEKGVIGVIDPKMLGYESMADMVKGYVPGSLAAETADGKLYGVPYQENSFDLWINKTDFKTAGLDPEKDAPKTWDELATVAGKLTQRDASGKITRQGFRWATQSAQWTILQFEPVLKQYGASILDASGKCALNSSQAVAAMKMRASFSQDLKAMDPSNSVATDPIPTNDFVKNNASTFIAHLPTIDLIKSGNPDMYKDRTFQVVTLPQKDPSRPVTLGYGFLYAYNAKAAKEKQLWAQDFIRYLVSNPAETMAKASTMSPRLGWQNDPSVKDFPYLDIFVKDLTTGQPVVRSSHFGEISEALHRAVQRVELNRVDVQKSFDQACDEINRAIVK